uniref:Complex I assembly factor TIMMDC1, mitochondrial n=1 Tax=Pristionchus pacificus TaxID=54126 RepID=A0A8R1Z729_PRIPA
MPSTSTDEMDDSPSTFRSWWRWRSIPISVIGEEESNKDVPIIPSSGQHSLLKAEGRREQKAPIDEAEMSGWDRIKEVYESDSMEKDVIRRVVRMSFFGGFLVGGSNGYLLAKQQYEIANKGRKYLSPSDAIKRRLDYAILRFAMKGFSFGIKAGLISGSVVLLSTHTAAITRHFSSLYFPAFSGVFTFPLGVVGMAKAFGLGISSGLTLSAVCGLYALSTDRSVDSAYWHLKKEYEIGLKEEGAFEKRVMQVIEERKVWRYEAVRIVKEEEDNKLKTLDA